MFLKEVDTFEVREEPKTEKPTEQRPAKEPRHRPSKPNSYSAVAEKGGPPKIRRVTPRCMFGVEIERTTTNPDQRRKLA